jgi:SAM-dependent methyltransferase
MGRGTATPVVIAQDPQPSDIPAHSTFADGRPVWLDRMIKVRNVVRQEMISRQLDRHLPPPRARILDVGAGQGTQSIRLARAGHHVLAIEPDPEMRAVFRAALGSERAEVRGRVTVADGSLGRLAAVTGGDRYDVVLLGVLMYLPSSEPVIAELAANAGLQLENWYGVRIAVDMDELDPAPPADPDQLAALLDVEERLGATDPYRQLAQLAHLMLRNG